MRLRFDRGTILIVDPPADLDLARARWAVAEAGVITAGHRPNPAVGFSPIYVSNAAGNTLPWLFGLNFDIPIETAGKRGYRIAQARQLSAAAQFNIALVAWQVRSRVRASLLSLLAAERAADRTGRLRRTAEALSGAEPVRPSTIAAFEEKFGVADVVSPCYGLAEATLAVAIWPRKTPRRLDGSRRFFSVGRPCPGVSVRIMDGAQEVKPDVEGEICVRSPGVMQGYYRNPVGTRRVLSGDGWLRTGDLGFVDREGFLFITGRLKDLIILGGENVIPADIEEIVDHIPGVRYSAAVGLENERTGTQRLHVVAEVRESTMDAEALSQLTREIVQRVHHGRGHRPARVLLTRPGSIPKTSSGKIQRSRLGQMIAQGELRDQLLRSGA